MTIYSYSVLAEFQHKLYDGILYNDNVIKNNAKIIEIENNEKGIIEEMEGFYLRKDEHKLYVMDKEFYPLLPIKVKEEQEVRLVDKNIAYKIDVPESFKINPKNIYSFKELVDMPNIKHSNPNHMLLWGIICHTAYISRIVCRVCSTSSFMKDGYLSAMDMLYDKVNVICPRSSPGFHNSITADGIIAPNEMSGIKKEVKNIVERAILNGLGDMKSQYNPGSLGSVAHGTKPIYDIHMLSVLMLFNNLDHYDNPNSFFDFMWTNNTAMNKRPLPIKLDGEVDNIQFKYDDPKEESSKNYNKYIDMVKSMAYHKDNWLEGVDIQLVNTLCNKFKCSVGRWNDSFREIVKGICKYYNNEPDNCTIMTHNLMTCHNDYLNMVKGVNHIKINEEVVQ